MDEERVYVTIHRLTDIVRKQQTQILDLIDIVHASLALLRQTGLDEFEERFSAALAEAREGSRPQRRMLEEGDREPAVDVLRNFRGTIQ
jgi:hypothetical protein